MKKISIMLIILSIILPIIPVGAENGTVNISNANEFAEFAKKCSVDTWSNGVKVNLTEDINLSGTEFKSVPTFSGSFNGNGHTISGIRLNNSGSERGLFRYVKPGAEIKDLKVSGEFTPSGSANNIGGIAGKNEGKITNCEFEGTIRGKSFIGGIAGTNAATGVISNSRMKGNVFGEHYVGGIVGQNYGTIISCTNEGGVNTDAAVIKPSLEDIDFENLISTQNTIEITDVGGIAGISSGILQSCENSGIVGHEHIGYNVGGIAGRQSGYISGCTNSAKVYGRKDVGGIVGQMEPYSSIKYSPSNIDSISSELKKLQSLLNDTSNSASAVNSSVSAKLGGIKSSADNALTCADKLADKTRDLINGNIDNINSSSARLTETVDSISDALTYCDKANDDIDAFIDKCSEITDSVGGISDITNEDADKIYKDTKSAIDSTRTALKQLNAAMKYINDSVDDIDEVLLAVRHMQKAVRELNKELDNLGSKFDELGTIFEKIADELKNGDLNGVAESFREMGKALKAMSELMKELKPAISNVGEKLDELVTAIVGMDTINIENAADSMAAAFRNLNSAMKSVSDVMDVLHGKIDFEALEGLGDKIKDANESLKSASDNIAETINGVSAALKDLADTPIITVTPIDEEYDNAVSDLSNSISEILDSFDGLNYTAKDGIDRITGDLQKVSDQVFVVVDIMTDALNEAYSGDIKTELSDRMSDISEFDTENQTEGKTAKCVSTGYVEGDINVGGITGSMAIEYDFDREDDITKNGKKSLNFVLISRAVVRECENSGEVVSKKNCVGGIAGRADLGCIINSTGGGSIKSKSGDYIGGIAGKSETVIKSCNSRALLQGDDYIGGIAGEASHIYDCKSSAYIESGDECIGAVAGNNTGKCARNSFYDYGIGGIDSISYAGIAEPADLNDLGDTFKSYTVLFKIDDEYVNSEKFMHNEKISGAKLPDIPSKDGNYGSWDIESFEGLTHDTVANVEYKPYITAIECDDERNGCAIVTSEGLYTEDTKLTIEKTDNIPAEILYKSIEAWEVKATDNASESSIIHYLPPEDAGKINIMVYDGSGFSDVNYEFDGSYCVFKGNSSDTVFVAVKHTPVYSLLIIIAYLAAAAAAVCIALWILRKIKAKRQKQNN